MVSSSSRPMAPVDAAWYRMDRANNPAVVTGLLLMDGRIDRETVQTVFADRLVPFERFRYRVVERGWIWSLPVWEPDPDFDLDRHVETRVLSPSATKEDLLDLVGRLASEPLDPDRPLWDATVIEWGPDRTALTIRFHHCMADGTGSIALAHQLFDPTPGAPDHRSTAERPSTLPQTSSLIHRTADYATRALETSARRIVRPVDTVAKLPELVDALRTAAESVLQSGDTESPLREELTGRQRLAYTDPIPISRVKSVGASVDATVNDVMVAALSGAVRRILQSLDLIPPFPPLRAIVPVDLRSAEEALALGNAFGLTFLPLPLNEPTVEGRLRAAKARMDGIKDSREAQVFLHILGLFGQLPRPLEDAASSLFASKASLVLTNVQGPSRDRHFAGHAVDDIVFWVPHPVSLGIGISILSYAGRISVGVISDAGVDVDPRTLTTEIQNEFDALTSQMLASSDTEARSTRSATTTSTRSEGAGA